MKKMGHFSLPSVLHEKLTMMWNLFDFLLDICLDAKPWLGGARFGAQVATSRIRNLKQLTIQTGLTYQSSIGLSLDISLELLPTICILLQQQQDPQIWLHYTSGVLADHT
jgi:hypothetical protein